MIGWNYIETLKNIALKSPMPNKHGAFILYNNKILSSGFNKYLFNRRHRDGNYLVSMHAEMAALNNIPKKYINKELTMIVIQVGKQDNLKLSRPCESCQKYIEKFNIKRVYYST